MKMQMKMGDYEVVKLYSTELGYTTEFFLPNNTLERKLSRRITLSDRKSAGYAIVAIAYVDEETYINLRINETIEDYCYEDRLEQEYRVKYRHGEIDREVYIDTMKSIQDYKWTCLKKLDMQMRRLFRKDYECYNEIAVQLYDQFLKGIM